MPHITEAPLTGHASVNAFSLINTDKYKSRSIFWLKRTHTHSMMRTRNIVLLAISSLLASAIEIEEISDTKER